MGWLYITYHLLREAKTTIDLGKVIFQSSRFRCETATLQGSHLEKGKIIDSKVFLKVAISERKGSSPFRTIFQGRAVKLQGCMWAFPGGYLLIHSIVRFRTTCKEASFSNEPASVFQGVNPYWLLGFIHPKWCRISSINSMLQFNCKIHKHPSSSSASLKRFSRPALMKPKRKNGMNVHLEYH